MGSIGLALSALLSASGCTTVTRWDVQGAWSGRVTLPGEAPTQRSSSLTDLHAGPDEGRIRLCGLSAVVLSLSFVPIERGNPAAIQVRTERPLCQAGPSRIVGGSVLVWGHPGSDENVLAAAPSDEWTVSGEIVVTGVSEHGLPDLDAGESATTQRMFGTFSVTATDASGSVILIEEGTLELSIVASRVRLSLS